MKGFVITIEDLPQSVSVAERCKKSAEKFGLSTELFPAITPQAKPRELLRKLRINDQYFKDDIGSRPDNVIATFLSHYRLWSQCASGKETFVIFEHDAVVVNEIPKFAIFTGCMNIGAPSYGKFEQPSMIGVNPLTSKPYFPGAHAYMLKPAAAKILIETATTNAMATDVFLQKAVFPWLEEFYPWPVIAKDTFTTIQNETGCLAKYNYKKNPTKYEFLKV